MRTSQTTGGRNTLPLELQGLTTMVTTHEGYAHTLITGLSLLAVGLTSAGIVVFRRLRTTWR